MIRRTAKKWPALAVALIAGLCGAVASSPHAEPIPTPATLLERELSGIVGRGTPGVVAIRSVRTMPGDPSMRASCEGSGVLLEGGLIATTLSVAGPDDDIRISYTDGSTSAARVVHVDALREVVFLEPERPGGHELILGTPDSLHAGSWVFVVGFSFCSPQVGLSTGRFSSRTILSPGESPPDTIEILQIEANVYPGNSGAAVLNAQGHLIGMVLGGLGRDGFLDPVVMTSFGDERPLTRRILTAEPPLGISFALPAGDLAAMAGVARSGGVERQGFLGVRVEMNSERQRALGYGVQIEDVGLGSPAANAGIRRGDLIVRINNSLVSSSQALASLIRTYDPGSEMQLELISEDGIKRSTSVTLGDYTSDYRMTVVRHRILSGRAGHLQAARQKLLERLNAVEEELQRVRLLAPRSLSQRGAP